MIVKPSLRFLTKDSDALLLTDVNNIVLAMTSNPNFPSPTPSIPTVSGAATIFATAVGNAADGGMELTAIKRAKRADLVTLVRQLASYVGIACNGDMAKLLSSGFPIQKPTRTPIGVLPAPAVPTLTLGARSGDLRAVTPPVFGAYIYNWKLSLATAPTVPVQTTQTTASRLTFTDLIPGQTYLIEANVVGASGPSDWSRTAESMVM